ncbi:3-methyl-2-oxobutanoate hydroxymethyltransferase [Taibaiella sp. KBW10]|uniref:3-methyl-2-oxobutanoate hydroxymethyltransferase n=1 Tax=Taibaiella sp. KBW10 TaxID=2153357 RepID=UPI000F5908AC|nr:3-methyl-2-oxobutanoate hydroxymethyltransferase [Taibaiella sp. KBW10]RQO32691.1 3-methyl-2-oxobutanoate hydroxymethyltransferase [Taibaiella sp. KBW10]
MSVHSEIKRVTTHTLQKMKVKGEKISMITAYDFAFSGIFDEAGIDIILVGDSASNVMMGYETTLPITLDQMIFMAGSVVRGAKRCFVVCDLPFGTYQGNSKEALNSSIRIMKEAGAHAVKLEGGLEVCDSIARIVSSGIPVMGHLGLTPQSIYKFGTYTVRAKEEVEAELLIKNAHAVQEAGAFALVLEKIPATLGKRISEELSIPVIGIGAGMHVDGQVLVMHDLLGITKDFSPRFLRRYANLRDDIHHATAKYIADVKSKDFPNDQEQY